MDGIIRLLEWILNAGREHILPFVVVREYEAGILLRMGRYAGNLEVGWNWKIPIIDEAQVIVKSIDTFHVENVSITTTDAKTVSVGAVIEFSIIDPKLYIISVNDALSNSHDIARGIIADYLSDCTWDEIKQKPTRTEVKKKLKKVFVDMGIEVHDLYFADISLNTVLTLRK